METFFDAYGSALGHLANPVVFGSLLLGVMLGLISGAIPGGGLPTLIILIGFGVYLDPFVALAIAIGSFAVVSTSDTMPSVMLGIPGSASAQATILDGYPMARQGRAGVALAAAYAASLIGGLIGVVGFAIALPFVRLILQTFGSAEFFLLGLLGIGIVAIVSAGAFLKGILAASFALTLSLIGFEPILGLQRMTFGFVFLADGFDLIAVIIGLFALPELFALIVSDSTIVDTASGYKMEDLNKQRREGIQEALSHKFLILRSSLIGFFIGTMPGVGSVPAHWTAYAQARVTEKGAGQTFGTGDVRGVIAPESANNAVDSGVLLPTITLGLPGSAGMAIMLGFFIIIGLTPGAKMLNEDLDITVFIGLCLVAANVLGTLIILQFSPLIAKAALIRPNILVPLLLGVLLISTFVRNAELTDLGVMFAFGILGTFMKRFGWPRPPFIIAFVLSTQVEKYLWLATQAYGYSMFARPQFIIMVLGMVTLAYLTLRVQKGAMVRQREVLAAEVGADTTEGESQPTTGSPE